MDAIQTVFQDYFPMIRFQLSDLLDIAILSFVIYKLLWMLRKTSSGRVMRGILIFLLAMFLSYALDLTATSFVLDRVVELGILALVILFQPELRRLLEKMGSGRIGQVFASSKEQEGAEVERGHPADHRGLRRHVRDKVGAPDGVRAAEPAGRHHQDGDPLDCSVSSELLKNLFWNKAPLHDGAVIVRDGRIVWGRAVCSPCPAT